MKTFELQAVDKSGNVLREKTVEAATEHEAHENVMPEFRALPNAYAIQPKVPTGFRRLIGPQWD